MKLNINFANQVQINRTNKDFILFDINTDNKITAFKLTNDLTRYRNRFQHFRLVEIIKQEINNKQIKL